MPRTNMHGYFKVDTPYQIRYGLVDRDKKDSPWEPCGETTRPRAQFRAYRAAINLYDKKATKEGLLSVDELHDMVPPEHFESLLRNFVYWEVRKNPYALSNLIQKHKYAVEEFFGSKK